MDSKPAFQRRNYLINPQFQLTMLTFFVGLAIVTIAVFWWSIKMVFQNLIELGTSLGEPTSQIVVQFIVEAQNKLNTVFISTSILLFLFMTLGGLILSHQIAGPVWKLQRHMQRIFSGEEPGALSFRKKDFFQELVPDFNNMIKKLRGK